MLYYTLKERYLRLQKMNHQPTKQKENNHPSPEYPFVLLRSPLHPPNRITTDPQRVANTVQPALRILENIALLSQILQHGATTIEKLVELGVCLRKEGLFA